MRARSAVQEHGICACDGHVEGSHIGLAVFKRNVAAVDTAVHGRACCIGSRLCDGVIAIAELELHYVAHRSVD